MLKIGGYINIIIAIAHIVGLLWADKMFEVTGIAEGMALAAQNIHPLYPYFITVVVAIFFFIFGLYGLSADGKFRKLPFMKPAIFLIAGIYLVRGIGELLFDMEMQQANQFLEVTYSLISVFIGLLFLIGGLKKWKLKRNDR
ncbi:hypothetical protein [Cecembia sp.]|uniref:hypothetical protein n=1 Tax=Cecembia sp. TaxID=1898110 RepID=UPI0025C65948|nr:hypothetical protein [Cecembia sp.]